MVQYISKSALVAEIESLKHITFTNFDEGVNCAVQTLIDTLEVKEINNVWNNASDFPKAEAGRSILLIEDNGHTELLKSPSVERLFYLRTKNLKMWAYVDELLSITTHFEVKEVDDEKCKEYDKALSIAKAWYKSSDSSAQERHVALMIMGDKVREEL